MGYNTGKGGITMCFQVYRYYMTQRPPGPGSQPRGSAILATHENQIEKYGQEEYEEIQRRNKDE